MIFMILLKSALFHNEWVTNALLAVVTMRNMFSPIGTTGFSDGFQPGGKRKLQAAISPIGTTDGPRIRQKHFISYTWHLSSRWDLWGIATLIAGLKPDAKTCRPAGTYSECFTLSWVFAQSLQAGMTNRKNLYPLIMIENLKIYTDSCLNPLKRVMLVSIPYVPKEPTAQELKVSISSNGSCWFLYYWNRLHQIQEKVYVSIPSNGSCWFLYDYNLDASSLLAFFVSIPSNGSCWFLFDDFHDLVKIGSLS